MLLVDRGSRSQPGWLDQRGSKASTPMGPPVEDASRTQARLASGCRFREILFGVWSAEPPLAADTALALQPHEDLFGTLSCW